MKRLFPSLLLSLAIVANAQESGPNLLTNGDFARGLDAWESVLHKEYHETAKPAAAVARPGGRSEVVAVVPMKSGASYFNIQQGIDLELGKTYRVTCEVRMIGDGTPVLSLWNREDRKNSGLIAKLPADAGWKRFEVLFTTRDLPTGELPNFMCNFGLVEGTVMVRNFSLTLTDLPARTRPEIKTAPLPDSGKEVSMTQVLADFAAGETAGYREPIQVVSPISAVSSAGGGRYLFTLEFGKVKLVGNGAELGPEGLKNLATQLKAANAKFAALKRSPKWGGFSPAEQAEHARAVFPVLHATGWISGYKAGILQVGKSRDLAVEFREE